VKPIHLIPLGLSNGSGQGLSVSPRFNDLEHLAASLVRTFRTSCQIRPETLDVSFAFDEGRRQYYSTPIIQRLERMADPDARVLGVTPCDLYVPVLTFVFGEAQLDGNCAVVSTARLHEEFYGERGVARTGSHLRTPSLRGLALRNGVESCGGAAGCQRRGFLRGLPAAGGTERPAVFLMV
jgi:hypothetical protein